MSINMDDVLPARHGLGREARRIVDDLVRAGVDEALILRVEEEFAMRERRQSVRERQAACREKKEARLAAKQAGKGARQ